MTSDSDSDWIQQERNHEYKMASLMEEVDRRRREQRTERFVAFMWAFGIVSVVAILSALIYLWQQDAGERGQKAEMACLTSGGTWTGLNGGADLCIGRVEPR
jgi:hypothetical protein